MSDAPIHALLDRYFNGLNTEDWQGLEDLMCDDAQLEAPGARRSGAAEVARYFRDALAPYPVHLDEPGRRLIAGSTATVEIRFVGRMASGAPMIFDAVDVFDFRDGRIARLTSWYDSHEVRRDLFAGLALGGDARAALTLAAGSVTGRSAHALGGRWHGEWPPVLALPATVVDAGGERPAGRALLLRDGATAIATAATGAPLLGSGFQLDGVPAGDGLLVSAPDSHGAAHAVLLR